MAVTGEVETAGESEQETTDSDSIKYCCTFCGHNYRVNPEGCEHLVCKVESLESNFDFVDAPDHPVTATLLGQEVPRVLATRFMAHIRNLTRRSPHQTASTSHGTASTSHGTASTSLGTASTPHSTGSTLPPSYVHTDSRGVVTVDLLAEKRATTGLSVIKSIHKSPSCFCERSFYLSACPAEVAPMFAPFVKRLYCAASDNVEIDVDGDMMDLEEQPSVPFSRVQICSEVMVLDAEDLIPEIYSAGSWIMLDGLPDLLPLFFFATQTLTHATPLFINHTANLSHRIKAWPCLPADVNVYVLDRLPSVVIN